METVLNVLEQEFSVCKLGKFDGASLPDGMFFFARTEDEISLVCETRCIPKDAVKVEGGWKALRVAGTLDFGLVGIIAGISAVLAEAGVSVFVVSTFDTDYVLMKDEGFQKGVAALKKAGY